MSKSAFAIYLPVLIWIPALFNFFSGDDWFHLRITQIDSLSQFFNFFSFSQTLQSASFYRPIPTQLFFFVFQKLFGLTAWPYHLFVLISFIYSLYLLNKLAKEHLKNDFQAKIATLIYGISVTHFTHLYFLSAFQEICLVIFALLSLITFKKSLVKSLIFFVLALLSKETAVVIPLLILIINYPNLKKSLAKLTGFFIVLLPYLYLRFAVFGLASGDSYLWNFSFIKALNTLMWYVLWSFGAPELLVDYIGSGLMPIGRFYSDLVLWWPLIIFPLIIILFSTAFLFIKRIASIKKIAQYILFFIVSLLPILFLPLHKFPLELGLPMVGFSLSLACLLPKSTIFRNTFLGIFIAYNILMMVLTYPRHYSVARAQISQKVDEYFNVNYKKYPQDKYFEFVNDSDYQSTTWGQSKQISQALSGSDFFKVFYKKSDVRVYYQDSPEALPSDMSPIFISTQQFLQ